MSRLNSIKELDKLSKEILSGKDPKRKCITVCGGTGCIAYGSPNVVDAFKKELKQQKLEDKVDILVTGCHGFCERGPLVVIRPEGIFYQRIKPENIHEIIKDTVIDGKILDHLLYTDPITGEKIVYEHEVPFYKKQVRLVFGNNGFIEPTSITDYIGIGGYSALAKVLSGMTPEKVIDIVKKSGLRGRGGGGFPTGVKWESCRKAEGDVRYVLCNADEGDPGAYMDRSVLEGNPHSVLEGMIIGAYAIGSHEGYIYVRQEYPLAVKHFGIALEKTREYGLLGKNILGSGFDFDITINRGGGAFVCGESTALMASIEGNPGEPRAKHVHTVEKGLWDRPSNLNNVETWANVPLIINKGWEWYSKIGTEKSKGTKIFSLVGKVNNTGLVEIPMGMTLREVVYDIGGGIRGGKNFKAVQTGGPSGGVIPESLLDLPVDFERLTEAGSMMGSGGMIVMDDSNCMVDIAKYFINFLKDESCGKCTPCRQGLIQMHQILTDICQGQGVIEDLALLDKLCWIVSETSLCQLGATAPNPVLTTIRYFRDEYQAHIIDRKCPGGVCKELIHYFVDEERCVSLGHGCGACRRSCPQQAISGEKNQLHRIDQNKCNKCGICLDTCKFEAIILE
ncbi:NADH-quinone oxidoreductase subunit NuoF [candidate division KSB1 bacterium]|nr:NADH-quinone oxidoreductase subunit NuoF [candidate division KSB1 bacterium]